MSTPSISSRRVTVGLLTTVTFFVSLFMSGSLSELQKLQKATAEAEMRLTWETVAHVWTQTETYATPAAAPVTDSVTLLLFPPASVLGHLPLYSVSESPSNSPHPSRLETRSIATGFPLIRLADPHKWSYCLCNDQLIGSFGCLFRYCPLIGALGCRGGIDCLQSHVADSRTVWVRRNRLWWVNSEEQTEGLTVKMCEDMNPREAGRWKMDVKIEGEVEEESAIGSTVND